MEFANRRNLLNLLLVFVVLQVGSILTAGLIYAFTSKGVEEILAGTMDVVFTAGALTGMAAFWVLKRRSGSTGEYRVERGEEGWVASHEGSSLTGEGGTPEEAVETLHESVNIWEETQQGGSRGRGRDNRGPF